MNEISLSLPAVKTSTTVRSHHGLAERWLGVGLRALSRISTGLAGRLLERLWLTPPRARRRPSRFATASERVLTCAHGELVVHDLGGGGPRVYLMHGWGGRADQFATLAASLVAGGYHVLAIDGPAHGLARGRQASGVAFAAAIRTAAAEYGEPSALVAHSLGSIGAALALQTGVRAPRLVFLAPPQGPRAYLSLLIETFGLPPAVEAFVARDMPSRLGFAWEELDLVARGPHADVELLVVHDRDDQEVAWQHGGAIAEAWGRARLLTTNGLGHRRLLRDPGVIAAVTSFVASGHGATLHLTR